MKFNILFKRAATMLLSVAMVLAVDSCAREVTVSAATLPDVSQQMQGVVRGATSASVMSSVMSGGQALDSLGVYAGETGFLCLILDDEGEIIAPNSQFEYILKAGQQYTICSYYIWHGEYDGDTLHDASVYVDMPAIINDDKHSELVFHFDNDRQPLNMAEWLRAEQGDLSISTGQALAILSDSTYFSSEETFTLHDLFNEKYRVKLGNSGVLDGNIVYSEAALSMQTQNGVIDLGRGVTAEGTPIIMLVMFIKAESAGISHVMFITVFLISVVLMAVVGICLCLRKAKKDSRLEV